MNIEEKDTDRTVRKTEKPSISFKTQKVVGTAVFSALAFIIALVCSPIPPVGGFLSLEVKDAIITIAAFVYGPISAVVASFIAAGLEFLTISTTGWYGFLMNFVSSTVFSLTAALIYSRKRSFGGSLVGIYSAVLTTTCAMLLMNIFVTPWYLVSFFGMPIEIAKGQVGELLPAIIFPFNFAKALLNSSVIMLIYKPLTAALSKAGIGVRTKGELKWSRRSAIIAGAAVAALAVAMTILIILWLKG